MGEIWDQMNGLYVLVAHQARPKRILLWCNEKPAMDLFYAHVTHDVTISIFRAVVRHYLINQTLRGSLVCTDELLLINQTNSPRRVAALVVTHYFKTQNVFFFIFLYTMT